MIHESVPLLFKGVNSDLSLFFATLCIIDIFGVFPIIALPNAVVQCGELHQHLVSLHEPFYSFLSLLFFSLSFFFKIFIYEKELQKKTKKRK